MTGRPILLDEDKQITLMTLPVLNYYQDAEAHIDKLEELIEVLKRVLKQ